MKKDKSLIPYGHYCYTFDHKGEYVCCPYWDRIEGAPHQADGFCHFLNQGDIEIGKDTVLTDIDTGEVTPHEDLPFNPSLLWDQVKECGINDNFDDEE